MKKRYCIKEIFATMGRYSGTPRKGTGILIKAWTYYYSDGTTEMVTMRIRNVKN